MKAILLILFIMITSTGMANHIDYDSIIKGHLELFLKEAKLRGVQLKADPDSLDLGVMKNLANSGLYGYCEKSKGKTTKIRFDKTYLTSLIRKNNQLKLEYYIFHEIAHALLDRDDELGKGGTIMDADVFNQRIIGFFKMEDRTARLDELFLGDSNES